MDIPDNVSLLGVIRPGYLTHLNKAELQLLEWQLP